MPRELATSDDNKSQIEIIAAVYPYWADEAGVIGLGGTGK